MHLELLTKQVANLSRVTGTFIRNEIQKVQVTDIESKGQNDFVTYVDKKAEKRLVKDLGKLLPEAGFIAEENPDLVVSEDYNWIIDPLDGTTNFIHGVPLYSISIALSYKKEIILGVVFEVNLQECFYAWQNGGAFLNGHPIAVSKTNNLKDSLLATGFPYSNFDKLDAYIDLFKHLMKTSHGIRRLGSAAVDLAYVACGRYDGFYEYGLHPWDVAAGSIIVEEAGGSLSDFKGKRNHIFGGEILAANANNYQEFFDIIQKYF